ncbi:hypothetical protein A3768_4240 (plasmid) [Ralstonia solanacearum]|nr:hypothetical protein A3768_4240 [Ralstonia solanacearum]
MIENARNRFPPGTQKCSQSFLSGYSPKKIQIQQTDIQI